MDKANMPKASFDGAPFGTCVVGSFRAEARGTVENDDGAPALIRFTAGAQRARLVSARGCRLPRKVRVIGSNDRITTRARLGRAIATSNGRPITFAEAS